MQELLVPFHCIIWDFVVKCFRNDPGYSAIRTCQKDTVSSQKNSYWPNMGQFEYQTVMV